VRMRKSSFALNVEGLADLACPCLALNFGDSERATQGADAFKGVKKVTIKVYIPRIYNVNTSLQCKYLKSKLNV
jgi:hypothetical protein